MEDLNDKIFGSTLLATEWNQVPSELQNIIEAQGLTLSSGDLNQLGKATSDYVVRGALHTDSGGVNTVVLAAIGSNQAITAYKDGLRLRFEPNNTNTGATTVNVSSLGVKNIFLDGLALAAGRIIAGQSVEIEYDLTNDRFNIVSLEKNINELSNLIGSQVTETPNDFNQVGKAVVDYVGYGNFYTESGGANTLVLSEVGSNQPPTAYKNGMQARFLINTTNTGSTTVNISSLGVKNLYFNGAALELGRLIAGKYVEIMYNSAGNRFDLMYVEEITEVLRDYSVRGHELRTAYYNDSTLALNTQTVTARSLYIRPDGFKLYVLSNSDDTIYQYAMTKAWDLSTAAYDSKSFSVGTEAPLPQSIFFKDDGLKLYVLDDGGNNIEQYTLGAAWDVSTASADSVTLSVGGETTSPRSMWIKPDGTKIYVTGAAVTYQYGLTGAWDLSTGSYDSKSYTSAEETLIFAVTFKPDGLKMFLAGNNSDTVYQHTLTTAWDVSTAQYDSISFDPAIGTPVGAGLFNPEAIFFKPDDGAKMYTVRSTNVHEYITNFVHI